ncbi:hypothetical protein RI367_001358 [Sorochytrium milnesiophthora]
MTRGSTPNAAQPETSQKKANTNAPAATTTNDTRKVRKQDTSKVAGSNSRKAKSSGASKAAYSSRARPAQGDTDKSQLGSIDEITPSHPSPTARQPSSTRPVAPTAAAARVTQANGAVVGASSSSRVTASTPHAAQPRPSGAASTRSTTRASAAAARAPVLASTVLRGAYTTQDLLSAIDSQDLDRLAAICPLAERTLLQQRLADLPAGLNERQRLDFLQHGYYVSEELTPRFIAQWMPARAEAAEAIKALIAAQPVTELGLVALLGQLPVPDPVNLIERFGPDAVPQPARAALSAAFANVCTPSASVPKGTVMATVVDWCAQGAVEDRIHWATLDQHTVRTQWRINMILLALYFATAPWIRCRDKSGNVVDKSQQEFAADRGIRKHDFTGLKQGATAMWRMDALRQVELHCLPDNEFDAYNLHRVSQKFQRAPAVVWRALNYSGTALNNALREGEARVAEFNKVVEWEEEFLQAGERGKGIENMKWYTATMERVVEQESRQRSSQAVTRSQASSAGARNREEVAEMVDTGAPADGERPTGNSEPAADDAATENDHTPESVTATDIGQSAAEDGNNSDQSSAPLKEKRRRQAVDPSDDQPAVKRAKVNDGKVEMASKLAASAAGPSRKRKAGKIGDECEPCHQRRPLTSLALARSIHAFARGDLKHAPDGHDLPAVQSAMAGYDDGIGNLSTEQRETRQERLLAARQKQLANAGGPRQSGLLPWCLDAMDVCLEDDNYWHHWEQELREVPLMVAAERQLTPYYIGVVPHPDASPPDGMIDISSAENLSDNDMAKVSRRQLFSLVGWQHLLRGTNRHPLLVVNPLWGDCNSAPSMFMVEVAIRRALATVTMNKNVDVMLLVPLQSHTQWAFELNAAKADILELANLPEFRLADSVRPTDMVFAQNVLEPLWTPPFYRVSDRYQWVYLTTRETRAGQDMGSLVAANGDRYIASSAKTSDERMLAMMGAVKLGVNMVGVMECSEVTEPRHAYPWVYKTGTPTDDFCLVLGSPTDAVYRTAEEAKKRKALRIVPTDLEAVLRRMCSSKLVCRRIWQRDSSRASDLAMLQARPEEEVVAVSDGAVPARVGGDESDGETEDATPMRSNSG